MDTVFVPEALASRLPLAVGVTLLLAIVFALRLRKKPMLANTPYLVEGLPVVGSWDFFTKRLDFCRNAIASSRTNSYSFWAGNYPVIGMHGEEARTFFFESRDLNMPEGYRVLLGGSPSDGKVGDPDYFSRRLVNMLKGGALRRGLPLLLDDVRSKLDELANDPSGVTDPFESIYRIVFQLTIRTVGCHELANDPKAMATMLSLFETIESSGDKPLSIMYPSLWTIDHFKRLTAGIRLYTMLNKIMEDRKKTGRREDDAMQYLIDQGDDTMKAVEFIMGALFAGQLNSGINAAWMILYLSSDKYWHDKVLAEIRQVAAKHNPQAPASMPLKDQLANLPIEAWESSFPTIDLCLRDTIRLNLMGVAMRCNISPRNLNIPHTSAKNGSGEIIPAGTFAIYPSYDAHLNPEIYEDPMKWDPSRYLPPRSEDTKQKYAWFGWGVARHPCLGMRFAKLEMSLIVAFWFAYFDSEVVKPVVDKAGKHWEKTAELPKNDYNWNSARKPKDKSWVRYWNRDSGKEGSSWPSE